MSLGNGNLRSDSRIENGSHWLESEGMILSGLVMDEGDWGHGDDG